MILISAYSLFGYTILEDFNDFLIDEDQLTIRLDRAGVLAGSENVRFMIGVEGETAGVLIDNLQEAYSGDKGLNLFFPKPIVGIGYKNDSFGIGFGYQFYYQAGIWSAHTPIITATALGEKLRLNIPVTIGIGSGDINKDDLAISTDIRLEYYFDTDIFSRLRINLKYGMYKMKANDSRSVAAPIIPSMPQIPNMPTISIGEDGKYGFIKDAYAHSIGIDLRAYFIAATDPVLIEPQIRLLYQGSVKDFKGTGYSVYIPRTGATHSGAAEFGLLIIDALSPMGGFDMDTSGMNYYDMSTHRIKSEVEGATIDIGGASYYITKPQLVGISVPVGFTAENDLISLYLEPALSFVMVTGGVNQYASSAKPVRIPPVFYSLGYLFHGELSITPVPNLEWFIEAEIGSATTIDSFGDSSQGSLVFNGNTGLTWKF